jgi:hypothetical protein
MQEVAVKAETAKIAKDETQAQLNTAKAEATQVETGLKAGQQMLDAHVAGMANAA